MKREHCADLKTAVRFVIDRIREEANRSGTPLNEVEEALLVELPAAPTNPSAHPGHYPGTAGPVLRDLPFERLCKLAKAALRHDFRTRPEAAQEWEFAAAVLQLNRHPMSWLLNWAGVKKLRPRWDRLLLIGAALLLILLMVFDAMAVAFLIDHLGETWRTPLYITGGLAYAALGTLIFLAAKRRETQALRRIVERDRHE